AVVTVQDNRSSANIGGGVLLGGTTFPLLDIGNGVTANVVHNDLSFNTANALGFGLRIIAIGSATAESGIVEGVVAAQITNNRLQGNRNSIMIDAGFPERNSPTGECDKRTFSARYDLTFAENTLSGSVRKAVLLSFTRGQIYTGNNATNNHARWQYLHGAQFTIDDPGQTLSLASAVTPASNTDIPAASLVLDHPERDRYVGGSCPDDVAPAETLDNTLIYNGQVIAPAPN
ncbi:MAG: hypothetical protein H6994_19135, partial [Pseudomonadales bacterium]|nr:hypothetical protein [Pseudomonadales bacterium]